MMITITTLATTNSSPNALSRIDSVEVVVIVSVGGLGVSVNSVVAVLVV